MIAMMIGERTNNPLYTIMAIILRNKNRIMHTISGGRNSRDYYFCSAMTCIDLTPPTPSVQVQVAYRQAFHLLLSHFRYPLYLFPLRGHLLNMNQLDDNKLIEFQSSFITTKYYGMVSIELSQRA